VFNMKSFADEFRKIAVAGATLEGAHKALPFLKQYGKPLGLVGAGALGYHMGKKELDKYMLGRRVYEQMQNQGG
jgi:hypothetical protein